LFTAEWIHNNTVTVDENGAVPPTPVELDEVFGASPRAAHRYGGQQTRVWQFSSQKAHHDWDITPFDPLSDFQVQRVNPRKGGSLQPAPGDPIDS
jgi:hypothetical protein